jgi:hypothetical protein
MKGRPVFGGLILLVGAFALYKNAPDIIRYLRMKSM